MPRKQSNSARKTSTDVKKNSRTNSRASGERVPTPLAPPPVIQLLDVEGAQRHEMEFLTPIHSTGHSFSEEGRKAQDNSSNETTPRSARGSKVSSTTGGLLGMPRWLGFRKGEKSKQALIFFSLHIIMAIYGVATSGSCFWNSLTGTESRTKSHYVALFLIFCHFVQALFASYYVRQIDCFLPKFVQLWYETYDSQQFSFVMSPWMLKSETMKKLHRNSVMYISYVFGGFAFFSVIQISQYMEIGDFVRSPDNCTSFSQLTSENGTVTQLLNMITLLPLCTCIIPTLYCQALYGFFCTVLSTEFESFSDKFERIHHTKNCAQEVGIYRQQHFSIVTLCEEVNARLCYYVCWVYSFNFPCMVSLLYVMLLDETITWKEQIGFSVYAFFLFIQLVIISIPPSFIHTLAVGPADEIIELANSFAVDVKLADEVNAQSEVQTTINEELYEQITLFQQQLDCKDGFGITCGGFFFLSQEMLLTLVSVLVSYFALILQFHMGAAGVCTCDCSNATLLMTTMAP